MHVPDVLQLFCFLIAGVASFPVVWGHADHGRKQKGLHNWNFRRYKGWRWRISLSIVKYLPCKNKQHYGDPQISRKHEHPDINAQRWQKWKQIWWLLNWLWEKNADACNTERVLEYQRKFLSKQLLGSDDWNVSLSMNIFHFEGCLRKGWLLILNFLFELFMYMDWERQTAWHESTNFGNKFELFAVFPEFVIAINTKLLVLVYRSTFKVKIGFHDFVDEGIFG